MCLRLQTKLEMRTSICITMIGDHHKHCSQQQHQSSEGSWETTTSTSRKVDKLLGQSPSTLIKTQSLTVLCWTLYQMNLSVEFKNNENPFNHLYEIDTIEDQTSIQIWTF